MLSDGLVAALGMLLLIGVIAGAVYAVRRLRRVTRVISDRERKWAFIVIAVVTLTKIPTVVSVLPELMKVGLGGTLLVVPMLFIFNVGLAVQGRTAKGGGTADGDPSP